MKYLLTYKLSQDHLELFFGTMRSAGDFNNNPTAQQFTAAYKRLLLRSSIQGGKGNCEWMDATHFFHCFDDTCKVEDEEIRMTNAAVILKYALDGKAAHQDDHDYDLAPDLESRS